MPLLAALGSAKRIQVQRAFGLGLATGIVAFAGTLYWISGVMMTYGGLTWPTALAVNALLVSYLAIFVGLFAVMVTYYDGTSTSVTVGIVTTSAAWVVSEFGRGYLFGGFPWELLGYSQVEVLPVAQLASVFGVYGISFLIVLVNGALASIAVRADRQRLITGGVVLGIAVSIAGWGQWRLSQNTLVNEGEPVRVAAIQGNVAQDKKHDPGFRTSILDTYLSASRSAAADGAKLLIWPESALPLPFNEDVGAAVAIRDLAKETGSHILFGSEEFEETGNFHYYNAAFHISPTGINGPTYRKIHLVPFGEYVPFRRLLFFADKLVSSVPDFSPGTEAVTFSMDGHRFSSAICYEVVYPSLARSAVSAGSELLTTITNDAWFGRTSAPHQHFSQAAMRAIEQGRYLVRAANTGISGVVDPYGRVLAQTELFENARVVADVRWINAKTVYGWTGDLFVYLCLMLVLCVLVIGVRASR